MRSRTTSVSIRCDPPKAYAYLSDPWNLPAWAPGLCAAIERAGEEWVATTAQGPVSVRFAEQNALGVLDHYVRVEPEAEALNPMRVVPNGSGCELMFTLFQRPGMGDEEFAADAGLVEADLNRARTILERQAAEAGSL
jgi:hypothetical protein